MKYAASLDLSTGSKLDPKPLCIWGRSDEIRSERGSLDPADARTDRRRQFDGFKASNGLRSGPKDMRIPPLRSAVKMGSDVSLDSSVILGRFMYHRTTDSWCI